MIDRRNFMVLSASCATALSGIAQALSPVVPTLHSGLTMTIQPGRVFKRSDDQNRLRREFWSFVLVVRAAQPQIPRMQRLSIEYRSQGKTVRTTRYGSAAVTALNLITKAAAGTQQPEYMVAAFQMADAAATVLQVDAVLCVLELKDGEAAPARFELEVPLEAYVQRTQLIFPFRGHGMISQGGAWNDGHRNRSGMFAIDAIGLTERYAPMIAAGDEPKALAGWGRPILAPAAGEIVVARADRPDQQVSGVSDPKYFAAEFPDGGDPGNHCVIDHGNGEFSMLAHFQADSLRVKLGERVRQGQRLGLLGNSGDTSAPHVHHQLQSGPQWTSADALPHVYVNGPEQNHNRGVMFEAR